MCAGVLFIVINDAIAKWLIDRYDPYQIIFGRSLLALPLITCLILARDGAAALKSARLRVHALRGLFAMGAIYTFYYGLSVMSLAEATSLIFAAPLFITALSATLLGDKVGWRSWSAVIAGFIGVLVIIQPGTATFQPASLYIIAAAAFYALVMISARWIDGRDNLRTMMFYMSLFPLVFSSFVLFTDWPVPTRLDAVLFAGMAVFGTLGVTLISQAFRMAPAAVVAPFDYTALIWATFLGWLLWGSVPGPLTYAGAAVIIVSGGYLIVRPDRQARPAEVAGE